ncbi:hypothetical protein AVEN_152551-1 [Araneus ventricosus]|uniref:Nucleic-acid-binding protein from transposon X-element n=1 Tax=Araneus ventricosus TaxID=182803 RepID=A0A4Y2MCT3_ARAVE|nr:hypothetical protein AVEN_152551-1 [Araneus ventricosus]
MQVRKKKIREGSLGQPGVATPVPTTDSKPPGIRKDPWVPRDWDTRTHLKKYTLPKSQSNIKTNWKKFTDNLIKSNNLNFIEINTPEQLDEAVFQFENLIMDAKIAASKSVPADQTYIDPTIRQLNNERNHARKMYQKTRKPGSEEERISRREENLKNIYNETIGYYIVKIEKYIRKSEGQCFNCQAFSHISANCKMNTKCVICAEPHDSRKCPKKGQENVERKCSNCGGPHTASFRGCPKFPKIKTSEKVHAGKSFASLLREKPMATPQPQENRFTPAEETNLPSQGTIRISEYFTDVFRLLHHIRSITNAIPNFQTLLTKMDQESNPHNKLFLLAEAFIALSAPASK